MSTVVLITGANRGIGHGLLSRYLALPNHTVVAAVRDPQHPTAEELASLPKAEDSSLLVVKIDALMWDDPFAAVKELQAKGIDHLDVVVANAGVCSVQPTVLQTREEDFMSHFTTNAKGLLSLFQAVHPLLERSKRQPEPVFLTMGTAAGSINAAVPFPNGVYGPSKAAAHWLSAKIDAETPWLNSLTIMPGFVQTEMGNAAAARLQMDEQAIAAYMITPDQACDAVLKIMATTSKAEHGGKFVNYTGEILPW